MASFTATDINVAGGILGKLSVEFGDDVSDPKQGVSVANTLLPTASSSSSVIGNPASPSPLRKFIRRTASPRSRRPRPIQRSPSAACGTFSVPAGDDQQAKSPAATFSRTSKAEIVVAPSMTRPPTAGPHDETLKTIKAGGMKEVLYHGITGRRQGLFGAGLKDQTSGSGSFISAGCAEGGSDRAANARSGRKGAADGRRFGITSDEFATVGGPKSRAR